MTSNVTIGESHFCVKQIVFLGGIKKPWPNGFSANDKQKLRLASNARLSTPSLRLGGRFRNPRRDFVLKCWLLATKGPLKEEAGDPQH